jgi:Tfp pilus assembly protein PilW
MFKDVLDNNTDPFSVTCKLKSTLAPNTNSVYLSIWNRTTSDWEVVAQNTTASANEEFTLYFRKSSGISDYTDANNVIVCDVCQLAEMPM